MSSELIRKFEGTFGPVNARYYAAGHLFGVVNSMNIDNAKDKVQFNYLLISINCHCYRYYSYLLIHLVVSADNNDCVYNLSYY